MMLLPRRPFVIGTLGWFSSATTSSADSQSIDDWADLICSYTPSTFRQAIQLSRHFLYRGGSSQAIVVEHPGPDLLTEGTYDDPKALEYFTALEERLGNFPARPSTAHVATSDPVDAGKWGNVVSVWPLGTEWSFVWPQERSTFFASNINNAVDDTLVLDKNLVEALKQPREVMFASTFPHGTMGLKKLPLSKNISSLWTSAFVAIPMEEEDVLRRKLQERNYGLSM